MRLRSSGSMTAPRTPQGEDAALPAGSGTTIGALLTDMGALNGAEVAAVLATQRQQGGLFGEVAVALNLVEPAMIERALRLQYGGGPAPLHAVEPATANSAVSAVFAIDHPMADRLREMRAALLGRKPVAGDAPMIVTVADAQPDTGAAMLAADLAASSAHLGYAILLVDSNVARPQQHRLFQIDNDRGVSDMGDWVRSGEKAIAPTAIRGLSLLAAGPAVDNASETIERLALSDQLRRIGRNFDMIVVDASAQEPSEAAAAAAGSDGFVLAVRRHRTPVQAVTRTLAAFADRGVDPLGLVMVA